MKINWREQFINLIVVILGITIAFWLNSWAEGRKSKRLEEQCTKGLMKDLTDDIGEMKHLIIYSENQLKDLNNMLSFMMGKTEASDSLTQQLFTIQFNLPFTPQEATYQSLSGKIETISDFEIRNKIIEYYNQHYARLKLWDSSCKENIDQFIKPVVLRELNFIERGQLDLKLFKSKELRNALYAMQYLFMQRLAYCHTFLETAEKLQEDLENYQGQF